MRKHRLEALAPRRGCTAVSPNNQHLVTNDDIYEPELSVLSLQRTGLWQ